MRNLKRALSLALASVMLVGMMVVGTGASYSDVTSKNNTEAIEVLQAVGIMTGDDKGNFNPDQNVTRNEMAVIMSNLMDYVAASYKGTAPFADVPAWAEPYVAACYTNGIIAGTSKTTYGGSATVTAGQAALMLMKALGYFQYQSDFGDDWLVETVKQATKIDLFDGVDTGATAALTRNQVAQMVLNALEADCVDSDGQGGVTVSGNGFSVTTGKATYEPRTGSGTKYNKIDKTETSNGKQIIQLGEDLYSGDLEKKDANGDDFGRPATTWKYKNAEIGTYADEADYSYVNKVTKGTLYSDVGKTVVDNTILTGTATDGQYKLSVSVDGKTTTVNSAEDLFKSNSSAHIQGMIDGAAKDNLTGNGVVTEVYVDDDKNTVTICIINTYVMQATADYNSSKESLSVDVLSGDCTDSTLDLDDFDTLASYAEDDYILYTYANNEIQTIAKASVVNGTVDTMTEDSVTIDGTKYSYSMSRASYTTEKKDGMTAFTADENAAIVLDANGFLVWIDNASISTGKYVYVQDAEASSLGSKTCKAAVYATDGVYSQIVVKKVKAGTDITAASAIESELDTNHGWYSYTKDSSDQYTLTKASTSTQVSYKATGANVSVIKGESVKFLGTADVVSGDTAILGNSSTTFIVDDGDDVTVYTGTDNAPDVTLANTKTATVTYLKVDDKSSKAYASLVFVDASNADVDEVSSTSDLMYIAKLDSTYKNSSDTVYVYKVIENGVEKTVEAIDELATKAQIAAGTAMFYKIMKDSDDRITDSSKAFPATKDEYRNVALSNDTVDYSDGALMIGGDGFTVASDASINLILMKGAGDVMKDEDATYEAYANISARSLYNTLKNHAVSGYYYAVTTENDNEVLKSLYVVITGSVTSAQAPSFGTQPTDKAFVTGNISGNLTAAASVTDGGNVTYQWTMDGSNSTATGNATASLTIPTDLAIGKHTFTCVATNTMNGWKATKTSDTATVTVAPEKPVYAIGSAVGNIAGKTVTITSTSDYAAGTYNLYKDGTKVATLTTTSAGALTFTGVTGTIESVDYTITTVVNSVESAQSDAIAVTAA